MQTTGFSTVRYKGVEVNIPRLTPSITDNGWIGPDHPDTASEEWGCEMLEACARYIGRFYRRIPENRFAAGLQAVLENRPRHVYGAAVFCSEKAAGRRPLSFMYCRPTGRQLRGAYRVKT